MSAPPPIALSIQQQVDIARALARLYREELQRGQSSAVELVRVKSAARLSGLESAARALITASSAVAIYEQTKRS